MKTYALIAAAVVSASAARPARAAEIFVAPGTGQDVSADDARAITSLVREAVVARLDDRVTDDEERADYVLQPRLVRMGDAYLVTVEKRSGQSILFAAQAKALRLVDFTQAAKRATDGAIDDRGLAGAARFTESEPIVSGATMPAFDRSPASASGGR